MKDATSCRPSSNSTLKMYCPVRGGTQMFVFVVASGLIFLSKFSAINVMLLLCVWNVLYETLCVTSETTASSGPSDGSRLPSFGLWHLVFRKQWCRRRFCDISIRRVISWLQRVVHIRVHRTLRCPCWTKYQCQLSAVIIRGVPMGILALEGRLASCILMSITWISGGMAGHCVIGCLLVKQKR